MNIHTSADPLHIYVINMKKDRDRMECFEKQVNSQFEYERIEGVDVTSHEYNDIYMKWREDKQFNINIENFDWKYYLHNYPDLIQAGIRTKQSAWSHWINHGKNELRSCTPNNDIVNQGQWGCLQSHINILRDAIDKQYKNIIVFEDDVIIRSSWSDILFELGRLSSWDQPEYVSHPSSANTSVSLQIDTGKKLIYLGASQHNWENIIHEDGFYYANNSTGTFAYMVNNELYREVLDTFEQRRKPVDNYLVEIQLKQSRQCVVMFPNKVICNLEESNIGQVRKNDVYYKKFKWV
jgi:GR25 family glycosyltransferase involved in LPS biosynthesis